MKSTRPILVAMLAAALGCKDGPTSPSAARLDGNWTRLDEVPGSSEHWMLGVHGSSIAGTGTWTGEACCSGPLVLTGTIAGDSIHVEVTLTATSGAPRVLHEHFNLVMATSTMLQGTMAFEIGAPGQTRFRKD